MTAIANTLLLLLLLLLRRSTNALSPSARSSFANTATAAESVAELQLPQQQEQLPPAQN